METQPYIPGTVPGGSAAPSDGVYLPGGFSDGTVMYSKPIEDRVILPTESQPLPKRTYES
jgi:hypothetical protein